MAVVSFPKRDLLNLLGRDVSDEILKEKIPMLGASLESFGNASDSSDSNIELDISANRPDLLSVEGFARALSSFLGIKTGLKKYTIKSSQKYKIKIDSKTKNIRPCVAAAVIKNIRLDNYTIQSIMQLQEKLHLTIGRDRKKVSIGVYDLDTIRFPLKYTTKPKTFQFKPLDSLNPMNLQQILKQHPKGIEYAGLLEGYEEYPVWIDSKAQVLSMPPIINSEQTRVREKTKNLFIDVTGIDQQAVEQALKIIATALTDRKADVYDVHKLDLRPGRIKIDPKYISKLLGIGIKQAELKKLAEKMGFSIAGNTIQIPPYRTDILHQVDIAEDIAIAYGYDKFIPEIKHLPSCAEEDKLEAFKRKISDILISLKFIETNTLNLSNKETMQKNMLSDIECIELENAINSEFNVLRSWMIPSLMQVLKNNKHNEYPQNIFEINRIFKKGLPESQHETGILEFERLAVLICHAKANFTDIRQILDNILTALNMNCKIEPVKHSSFIEGRVGRVSVSGKKIAYIGEIAPPVLENFTIGMPVAGLELNISELFELIRLNNSQIA